MEGAKLLYRLWLKEGLCRNGDVGDYKQAEDGVWDLIASDVKEHFFSLLILLHEFIEQMITEREGLSEATIDAFDKWFDQGRRLRIFPKDAWASRDHQAPYGEAHRFIEAGPELLVCAKLGFTWKEYDQRLNEFLKELSSPKVEGIENL